MFFLFNSVKHAHSMEFSLPMSWMPMSWIWNHIPNILCQINYYHWSVSFILCYIIVTFWCNDTWFSNQVQTIRRPWIFIMWFYVILESRWWICCYNVENNNFDLPTNKLIHNYIFNTTVAGWFGCSYWELIKAVMCLFWAHNDIYLTTISNTIIHIS